MSVGVKNLELMNFVEFDCNFQMLLPVHAVLPRINKDFQFKRKVLFFNLNFITSKNLLNSAPA